MAAITETSEEVMDKVRKVLEGGIVLLKGDEDAPYSALQSYLLLKILDRLESIDDTLIMIYNPS
jgi:hypothetical protein